MDYKKIEEDVTVILGDEYDDELRAKLINVLHQLGAVNSGPAQQFLVGSQDVQECDVNIDGKIIHIEAETYVGLSVSGPSNIVKRIQELIIL
ncbi:MAG TPA: hypothetical protein VIM59_00630 [Cellvibrio sp.]